MIYRRKYLENTFPTVYYMPINFWDFIRKGKKEKKCSRLATADQSGQKNRNGKTTAILFDILFY